MILTPLLLILPAQVAPPPAPSALTLDLSGALDKARKNNAMLKAAKARVDERRSLITATRADAFPQVALVADATRTRDVTNLLANPNLNIKPVNIYTTQATLNQPLFYWGKIGTAVKIAKMGEEEATFAYTTAELDILHGVAKAYLGVLGAQAQLEVVESRRKTAEQFLADVKSKLEAQMATELDRLRAESEYLAVLPESLQAEAAFQRAKEVLNGQLGMDPKTPLELKELGTPDLTRPLVGVERSELQQFKEQEAMYQANDTILQSDLRPKFDLSAAYGFKTSQSDSLFKEPYDNWRVSVTMRFPIFDGLRTSGRRAQNRAVIDQVRQARIDTERAIAVEKSTAERELQKAIAFQDAAVKAHDMGAEALRVSRESFELGLITSLDLLQAERTERQLESQRRQASLGLWSAHFDHRRSLGLLPF